METVAKEKVIYGSFTEDRLVSVKAVESSGKWSTLLVKGQERSKDPFLYNKVKRSYQVPLKSYVNGGGVKVILDDQKKVKIQKYSEKFPEGMTERQFFETELGADLNPTLKIEENFWRNNRLGRVVITKEGLQLNLNLPLDMLKYKILLSNKNLIAPSYDSRNDKATYEFMIVDESKVVTQKLEEASLRANAYVKFAEITNSKANTIGFIKSLGRAIPVSATEDWMKGEVLKIVENDAKNFLEIVNHPQYKERIFVQEAVEAGAILRKGENRYTLDNGHELGDLTDTINYLMNPDYQEVKLRIKAKIELSKKK
jgi:hypothetical protein